MKKSLLLFLFSFTFTLSYAQTDSTTHAALKQDVLRETKKGGKLDFFSPIKGNEYDGVQIKPGVYDTKLGLAIINWGEATRLMGVSSLEESYSIFSAYKKREINDLEKTYIKIGFNGEIKK